MLDAPEAEALGLVDNAILRPGQKQLLEALARSPLAKSFYLTGGTALAAFHLGHRVSDDLDLFSEAEFPIEAVLEFLRGLEMGVPDYQHLFDRRIFLLPSAPDGVLKVEFTRYPFARCELGPEVDGVRIDSLRDILANKLVALTERREPKDLVDVYCGARAPQAPEIDALVDDAERKFGVRGVRDMLRARFLGELPRLTSLEMRTSVEPGDVGRFFGETARRWVRESLENGE
jgi:predicted nucleotidyltransferase component of viral defense system